jgi:hypothetical protein
LQIRFYFEGIIFKIWCNLKNKKRVGGGGREEEKEKEEGDLQFLDQERPCHTW